MPTYISRLIQICCGLCLFTACQQEAPVFKEYIFLGHPYQWGDSVRVDERLEKLDFSLYDQVWLGGDVSSKTTLKPSTIDYIDSLFDLGSDRLQWTLGNHDVMYGNLHLITERTGRNTFYTTYFDNICLLVLNTNLFYMMPWGTPPQENCEEKQAQLDLIKTVTDTVKDAQHLVILHHFGLLNELKKDRKGQLMEVFNANLNHIRTTCDSTSDFTKTVYPWLEKVQKRGVQVSLIGGDFGMKAKEFVYKTNEGIYLVGSGINNSVNPEHAPEYVTNFDPDKVLIVRNNLSSGKIEWHYEVLNELVEKHQAIK